MNRTHVNGVPLELEQYVWKNVRVNDTLELRVTAWKIVNRYTQYGTKGTAHCIGRFCVMVYT